MSAPKQWLVVPANPEGRAYLTEHATVAEKREKKGDTVTLIKRNHDVDTPDEGDEL